MSSNATIERPGTLRGRLKVIPWFTVVPLAVVMAYADGFWMVSLRGAVGSIERTNDPFVTWLTESTLVLPLFVLAVLGVLTLAARWFGPVLRTPKTVVAATLMVVAAGTLVGIAWVATSSAYDYHLQSDQLQLMGSMTGMTGMPGMGSADQQQQASLALQMLALGYGSAILLVTNLALVPWVVALRGGRLNVSKTRP
jgi:glucan phosphoethanolaminetransferase (alkaline phosphatase superfamily)